MVGSQRECESPQPPPSASDPATEPRATTSKSQMPTSPARSDKSSESEGRPVREKLKETRIDAQASSDLPYGSDHPMDDIPNGNGNHTTRAGDQNSELERGRLRRKRSRDDFEDMDGPLEKKLERHSRKNSRDVSHGKDKNADNGITLKSPVGAIREHQDETMENTDKTASARSTTPEVTTSDKDAATVISPKNKRTLDEAKSGENVGVEQADVTSNGAQSAEKTDEERHPKRQRDKTDSDVSSEIRETKAKIPPTSGFANASAASPFAALSPKKPAALEQPKQGLPQTSDEKFKASGFGSFAASTASPFGGLGSSSSSSPFAAAGASKLTSFTGPTNSSTSTGSGFGALGGGSSKSTFGGGSTFSGSLGASAFSGFGGSKSGLSSFATPGASTITGLSRTKEASFGAPEEKKEEESDEDGAEDESPEDEDTERAEKSKRLGSDKPILQPQQLETGEEGESTEWTGRAKLYTLSGDGKEKAWHERGVGPFKLNISNDEPRRARFVLRADGTHRLLLNAAITQTMNFGDPEGKKPKDGKLFFNSPTADGILEAHLLKMKVERAAELYDKVLGIKETYL